MDRSDIPPAWAYVWRGLCRAGVIGGAWVVAGLLVLTWWAPPEGRPRR